MGEEEGYVKKQVEIQVVRLVAMVMVLVTGIIGDWPFQVNITRRKKLKSNTVMDWHSPLLDMVLVLALVLAIQNPSNHPLNLKPLALAKPLAKVEKDLDLVVVVMAF